LQGTVPAGRGFLFIHNYPPAVAPKAGCGAYLARSPWPYNTASEANTQAEFAFIPAAKQKNAKICLK
jgi:hypothetical protein